MNKLTVGREVSRMNFFASQGLPGVTLCLMLMRLANWKSYQIHDTEITAFIQINVLLLLLT